MNSTKCLLSVVMPVYNAERYLELSIESVLNQTFSNFEFIIIDDGSRDGSLEIIKKYSSIDNRIRVISRENKGLVYTLNEGIKNSHYKYIARMDADDICLPERFEKEIEFLENNKQYGVVSTFIRVFGDAYDEKMNKKIEDKHNKENIELIDLLSTNYVICHPTVMFRKEIIDQHGGYNSKYEYCEDLELWIRLLRNGVKFKNIPIKLLKYRKNIGSKTNRELNYYIKDIINMRLETLEYLNILSNKKFSYYIWGAGSGGKEFFKRCSEKFPNSYCIGFVDMYKKGEFCDKKIYSPNEIKNAEFDYVFIATTPGALYANVYLSFLNKNIIKDYINVF